jgi:aquaporin Z
MLLEHPTSPIRAAMPTDRLRRAVMGAAMGLTAIAIVYSRFGKRSGAHFNPCVTLTFFRLGKVAPTDALLYMVAQFMGGIAGATLAALALGEALGDPAVRFVVTVPGPRGLGVAFAAEAAISFLLMAIVLTVSNTPRLSRFTGIASGLLVATYIRFEAPLSGMSMNPARTLGSALAAFEWRGLWITSSPRCSACSAPPSSTSAPSVKTESFAPSSITRATCRASSARTALARFSSNLRRVSWQTTTTTT